MNLVYSSKTSKQWRSVVEELLFFNPRQHLVREGIVQAVQRFGKPRLEETEDGLSVRIGDQEAQTLFAFDRSRSSGEPVGIVVFLRTSPEEIAIIHVAVHPDYALRGGQAGIGLGVILLEKVKEIAARIVGVKRVVFFYRQEVILRV